MKTPSQLYMNRGGDHPLTAFAQGRVGSNVADARKQSTPVQAIVGHPQNGQVAVVGARGWFWAQRPNPGVPGNSSSPNNPTVVMFFCPSEMDGKPKFDLKKDMVVFLRASSDTQPIHWVLEGEPSDIGIPRPGLFDPCTNSLSCSVGVPNSSLKSVYGLNSKTSSYNPNPWPNSNSPTPDNPNNPLHNLKFPGDYCVDITRDDKYKATPRYDKTPDPYAQPGDKWIDPNTGTEYTRSIYQTWEASSGQRAANYVTGKLITSCQKGDILYYKIVAVTPGQASNQLDLADSSNPDCVGRIAGVAIADYSAGQLATCQSLNIFDFPNPFNSNANYTVFNDISVVAGTPVYLGTAGKWTLTPPAVGSSAALVVVGYVLQKGYYLQLAFEHQLKRGQTQTPTGGWPSRATGDTGNGVWTGGGTDVRTTPTSKYSLDPSFTINHLAPNWYFS